MTESIDAFDEKVEMSYNYAMTEVIKNKLCKLLVIIVLLIDGFYCYVISWEYHICI